MFSSVFSRVATVLFDTESEKNIVLKSAKVVQEVNTSVVVVIEEKAEQKEEIKSKCLPVNCRNE